MLNTIHKFMMIAVAALCTAAISQAQSLKVDVPFEFKAGDVQMAPGIYDVSRLHSQVAPVYVVRGRETAKTVGVLAQQHAVSTADTKAVLQFRCVAGQCQLVQIEMPGVGTSKFPVSKRNVEAAGQKVAMIRIPAL